MSGEDENMVSEWRDDLVRLRKMARMASNECIQIVRRRSTWAVTAFSNLPMWMQDNYYLQHGHRPPMPCFKKCFKSIFRIHTETVNIWTHLLGSITFLLAQAVLILDPPAFFNSTDVFMFCVYYMSATWALACSALFHTLCCHSIEISNLFSKLDYCGISILIPGSFIPWIYYCFYFKPTVMVTYITLVIAFAIVCAVLSLEPRFGTTEYRLLRTGVFTAYGLFGLVPGFHFVYLEGSSKAFGEGGLGWLAFTAFLYLFGTFLYATRIPERFLPGKFDIWLQSHQIFHVCIISAALTHLQCITDVALFRLIAPSQMANS